MLTKQAKQLQQVVESATNDVSQLQEVITRRKVHDMQNEEACKRFDSNMNTHLDTMKNDLGAFSSNFDASAATIIQLISELHNHFQAFTNNFLFLPNPIADEHTEKTKMMCTTSIKKMKVLIEREQEHEANIEKILTDENVEVKQTINIHSEQNSNIMDIARAQKIELSEQFDNFSSQIFQSFASLHQYNEQLQQQVTDMSAILSNYSQTEVRDEQTRSDNMINSMKSNRQIITESMQSNDQINSDLNLILENLKLVITKNQSNKESIGNVEQNLRTNEAHIKSNCDERLRTLDGHKTGIGATLNSVTQLVSKYNGSLKEITSNTTEMINVNKNEEAALFGGLQKIDSNFTTQNNAVSELFQRTVTKVDDIAKRKKQDSISGLNILAANVRVENDRTDADRQRITETTQSMQSTQTEYEIKLQSDIQHCASQLITFQKEELQMYKPSGDTPSKREYGFPRVLSATSPTAKIVQEFWHNPSTADLNCSAISLEVSQILNNSE